MEALVLAHAKALQEARVRRALEQLWLVLLSGWSVCACAVRSLGVSLSALTANKHHSHRPPYSPRFPLWPGVPDRVGWSQSVAHLACQPHISAKRSSATTAGHAHRYPPTHMHPHTCTPRSGALPPRPKTRPVIKTSASSVQLGSPVPSSRLSTQIVRRVAARWWPSCLRRSRCARAARSISS